MLGTPHVGRLLGGTLLGRLPSGMAPVALVLWAISAGHSIAFGGLLCALYGLASALAQPVKGRLMDRHGQYAVHVPCALLTAALLATLPLTGLYGGPVLALALVTAAGLTTPALEAGLRSLWPSLIRDRRLRHTALALDAGAQGLLYIAGPLLAAALASAYSPAAALACTAALGLVGTLTVATAPPSRHWLATPTTAGGGSARRLASGPLIALFVALSGIGAAIGALNVWAVAMADTHRQVMLSGLIPAVFSTGVFLGGLVYGHRTWPGTTTRQLHCAVTGFLAGWLPLLAVPGPHVAAVAVLVPGVFLTVVVACAYMRTDALTPTGRTSEAYAWLILSIGVGQAAGTALAGHLADHPWASAALPAIGAVFALTVLLLAAPANAPARRDHA
ncbi:MFS transporter [Streptomyces sp. SCSIO 30461]|uniref:MFS transporter n=1 Tax=Streptomyces sp. SCSIO 30461 TaxID=3118085 RepID=UPI0030CE1D53